MKVLINFNQKNRVSFSFRLSEKDKNDLEQCINKLTSIKNKIEKLKITFKVNNMVNSVLKKLEPPKESKKSQFQAVEAEPIKYIQNEFNKSIKEIKEKFEARKESISFFAKLFKTKSYKSDLRKYEEEFKKERNAFIKTFTKKFGIESSEVRDENFDKSIEELNKLFDELQEPQKPGSVPQKHKISWPSAEKPEIRQVATEAGLIAQDVREFDPVKYEQAKKKQM